MQLTLINIIKKFILKFEKLLYLFLVKNLLIQKIKSNANLLFK